MQCLQGLAEECYYNRNNESAEEAKSYHQKVVNNFEKLQTTEGLLDSLPPTRTRGFNLNFELAESLYYLGKHEDVISGLETVASYDLNNEISEVDLFRMHLLKCLCYENSGSKDAAWGEFKKAAEIIDSPEKNADEWEFTFDSALSENPYYMIKDKAIISEYTEKYKQEGRFSQL